MALISTQTTVTIADASAVVTTADMTLQASVVGSLALRQLIYPDATVFAPITYEKNPDEWTNFDSSPLVKRPTVASLKTLEDNKLTGWQGFSKDASITETWQGSTSEAPITLDFFRQLYAYYENPPVNGFIVWSPLDRTLNQYNILIERLTVGGGQVKFNYIAAQHGFLTEDVTFQFRIVSQV
ncbi:MAG: hypothetical protein ACYSUC_02175 [Planctomycetota bacterium]|jgi:hypothetical protein